MKADEFRKLALSFPEAVEQEHHGHPDFRVGGKVFATLGPEGDRGMVKLTPDEQASVMESAPGVFEPASGAWGKGGSTIVTLARAPRGKVGAALEAAWRNTAPKRLVRELEDE